jgi:pSer/pThr/pTyr-binding forkhead associated (FHA) protein
MPRLSVQGPDREGDTPEMLEGPFAVIGRDPNADLVLDHPDVSRRHAYLQVVAGRPFLIDLASRAGVYWGDERRSSGWVPRGEAVRIGPFLVRPQLEGPGDDGADGPAPTSRSFRLPEASDIALDLPAPGSGRMLWQASRVLMLVGEAAACRVRLPGVSGFHAAIVRTPAGAWVVGLSGRGGIEVNGAPARHALLEDGDEVSIGPHRIGVRIGVHALPARPNRARPVVRSTAPRREVSDPLLAAVVEEFGHIQENMADQFQHALLTMFHHFSAMHKDQMALIREELAKVREMTTRDGLRLSLPPPVPRPTAGVELPDPGPLHDAPAPAGRDAPKPAAPPSVGPPPYSELPDQLEIHRVLFERLQSLHEEREGRWQKLLGSMFGKSS